MQSSTISAISTTVPFTLIIWLLKSILLTTVVECWPDGSPCTTSTIMESMDPSEAPEHRGGLQLTTPPFTIDVKDDCYVKNRPIELTLRGNTTSDQFKGFVIQSRIYSGADEGRRIGEFVRLDDNGSWQQQCFRIKSSVTHSHNTKKHKIKLWWKNTRDDTHLVQFIATVVKSQHEFWVKSVVSRPIAPCKFNPRPITNFARMPVTPPPTVNTFKWESYQLFQNSDGALTDSVLQDDHAFDKEFTPKPQRFEDAFRTTEAPIVITRPPVHHQQRERLNHHQQQQQQQRQQELDQYQQQERQRQQQWYQQQQLQQQQQQQQQRQRQPTSTDSTSTNRQHVGELVRHRGGSRTQPQSSVVQNNVLRQPVRQQQLLTSRGNFVLYNPNNMRVQQPQIQQIMRTALTPGFDQGPVNFQPINFYPPRQQSRACVDYENPFKCQQWAYMCSTNAYVRQYCPRTCRICI